MMPFSKFFQSKMRGISSKSFGDDRKGFTIKNSPKKLPMD
jgi:hypothetical protein